MQRPYQMCSKTVMDTTDPDIVFDADGVSNHYHEFMALAKARIPDPENRERLFAQTIEKIKNAGRNQEYDCILGVSGGVDSSYIAYLAGENGLRPLVVHFDNGWNSELAVGNIEKIINKYKFDLNTLVVNWDEFRDIQIAYFKASVINIEAITDHAISATMFKLAAKHNIKYILSGSNMATEGILPSSWAYTALDLKNLRSIHRRFGKIRLKTFPRMGIFKYAYYSYCKRVHKITLLNMVNYDYRQAIKTLEDKLNWTYYGGKHHESVFTKWYQAYYLPVKFNVDKRKAHYSSMICSGQISREEALEHLKKPLYDTHELKNDTEYVLKKLGMRADEFEAIIKAKPVAHTFYPNNEALTRLMFKLKRFFN